MVQKEILMIEDGARRYADLVVGNLEHDNFLNYEIVRESFSNGARSLLNFYAWKPITICDYFISEECLKHIQANLPILLRYANGDMKLIKSKEELDEELFSAGDSMISHYKIVDDAIQMI